MNEEPLHFGVWLDESTVDALGLEKAVRFLGWQRDESVDAIEGRFGPGRWVIPPTVRPCDGTGVVIDDQSGMEWHGAYLPDVPPADQPASCAQRTGQRPAWNEHEITEFIADLRVLSDS